MALWVQALIEKLGRIRHFSVGSGVLPVFLFLLHSAFAIVIRYNFYGAMHVPVFSIEWTHVFFPCASALLFCTVVNMNCVQITAQFGCFVYSLVLVLSLARLLSIPFTHSSALCIVHIYGRVISANYLSQFFFRSSSTLSVYIYILFLELNSATTMIRAQFFPNGVVIDEAFSYEYISF